MTKYNKLRVLISGGGTGGHIFPAVSIAGALKSVNPETEILFVGAEGRMEMEKVPAAGYKIVGLPMVGLQRRLNAGNLKNNLSIPVKLAVSLRRASGIIDSFRPDVVVGVGGYASAPLLRVACRKGVPTLIQEQNGFAGLTNRILSKKAGRICVAYEGMERFFPADKIVLTGNPIRSDIHPYSESEKAEGIAFYGLDPARRHILIVGGSLGSRTLNEAVKAWIADGCKGGEDVEILWQCGRYYKSSVDAFMEGRRLPAVHYSEFIGRMDLAYACADIVISRSGASSVSEICAAHKAAVFVPSPNVAEDHQTFNAMALVDRGAALIVKDADAITSLMPAALKLAGDRDATRDIEEKAALMARPGAAMAIVNEIYKLTSK